MSRTRIGQLTAAVLAVWPCFTTAHAQISQTTLQGTIKDNSGAVIPGAAITLKNKGTAAIRTATTDASGQYAIPNADPAEYTLTVTFRGFKPLQSPA